MSDLDPATPINRESSWLEFNRRVLHEALDSRTPLLERIQFLAIFTSNLDEYVMKRVGGMKRKLLGSPPDAAAVTRQLKDIRAWILPMLAEQGRCFRDEIVPALRAHGVHLLARGQQTQAEQAFCRDRFRSQMFPILTPLAVDPGHPFPFLSNLSESLGAVVSHPGREEQLFARVKIPPSLPRFVEMSADPAAPDARRFARLEDIIADNMGELFPGMEIHGVMKFRITRNADIERDEDDAEDILEMVEQELRERRFASVVRLEHGPDTDPWILSFLTDELGLSPDDLYELPGELDYGNLRMFCDLPVPGGRHEAWNPVVPAALRDAEADIFGVIRAGDILLHHPYESFTASVERLVSEAADDPRVQAIKMTLYRTGENSPFVSHLIRAAENGKQVVVLVELKARFDEQRNIRVAQRLEAAGVHVVYGVVGLKTHTKTILVVRSENDGLRCYAHIGTGNYHAGNARLYTDLGLLTCAPALTADIVALFNFLTGRSQKADYDKLLVAPVNMKPRFLAMIEAETAHAAAGRPCGIAAKMNSLEDREVMDALRRAAKAGVPVRLIVRGFCCLRPVEERGGGSIRILSVVGRFLEHSRVFHFRAGAENPEDGLFFIGSADWMYRNLQARVEAVAPVEAPALKRKLLSIIELMWSDRRQAWELQPDGSYVQRQPKADGAEEADLGSHVALMRRAAAE